MYIGEADTTDIAAIHSLLAEAGLPIDDLKGSSKARFLIAHDDDETSGAVGLEVYGKSALLRSLVVKPEARKRGLGAQLMRELECRAKNQGVDCLYLLTTTAEKFFAARGYHRLNRERVPQDIAATTEFKLLCPSSAVCMRKQLGE
ncbi:MAG: GNAT family N-acetyltransferase [Gammaproteobacteria bacterium]|nr:GNAT family N-acetyltransferase [Gammaproteobacteria bacterium]